MRQWHRIDDKEIDDHYDPGMQVPPTTTGGDHKRKYLGFGQVYY